MSSLIKSSKPPKEDREVVYVPFGSSDEIRISIAIIRNMIAVPTREGELPDDRDCGKFMMLCSARKLNPFEGDAFLIGFKKRGDDKATWSLITSHQAFLKRAENSKDFNGMKSGVIISPPVECKPCEGKGTLSENVCPTCDGRGYNDEIEGDFLPAQINGEDVTLVGGWAKVYVKGREHCAHQRLKLSTYKKEFGIWLQDAAGMICKCAEAAAMRQTFPTTLGGLFMREEKEAFATVVSDNAKAPKFEQEIPERSTAAEALPAIEASSPAETVEPSTTEQPPPDKSRPTVKQATKMATTESEKPQTQEKDYGHMAKMIHFKAAAKGVTDAEVLDFAHGMGATNVLHPTLADMAEHDPDATEMFHRQVDDIVARIVSDKKANKTT